ncbi:InlB B-repeat-containing protein, partial [Syntrophomonas palmitatica]|uniref:InlB B-repeat-containing protein n=1 Tax=Syntrophomonas palmitatica TaxID=402877 RepID=UPI000ADA5D31
TVTIKAAPAVTYTVTFDKNGGDTEADPASKTVESGGNVGTLPTPPTRTSCTFAGWNTEANGSGDIFTAATKVTSDITVYAQWTLIPPTDAEKVAADKTVLEIGFAPGDSASSVTQNLNLTVTGAVYGSTITWISNNIDVISNNGEVTRPLYASGDAAVTLTATISSNGVSEPKAFTLTVLKRAQVTLQSIAITKTGRQTGVYRGRTPGHYRHGSKGTYSDGSSKNETITTTN